MTITTVGAIVLTWAGGWAFAQSSSLTQREAAMRVMGSSIFVVGTTAYCAKNYGLPKAELEYVAAWNTKHDAILRKAVAVVENTGGMSNEERSLLDKTALRLIKEYFAGENAKALCAQLIEGVKSGAADLSQMPGSKEALPVLMAQ